jgi:hypothetical protein
LIDPLHSQIHHHCVGVVFGDRIANLVAVAAFGDDDESVLAAQYPAQARADQILVVDQ